MTDKEVYNVVYCDLSIELILSGKGDYFIVS